MAEQTYTLLIVEDDKTIAEKVQAHLTQWGYLVVLATNFQDILADVAACKPDLILMDITLPYFNGF